MELPLHEERKAQVVAAGEALAVAFPCDIAAEGDGADKVEGLGYDGSARAAVLHVGG